MSAGRPGSKSRSSPSSSASNGSSSTPRPWPPPRRSPMRRTAGTPSSPASPRTAASCSSRTGSWPARSRTNARSPRPPNGSSTTSTIVDEQLREIRDDLPADYYRELPKLAEGHLAGYPARPRPRLGVHRPHGQPVRPGEPAADGRAPTRRCEPLTIGELWAIAISLRILLVENLRRLAEQIVRSRAARQTADELADGLLGLGRDGAGGRGGGPAPAVARARCRPPAGSSSSSGCATRIPAVTPALALARGAPRRRRARPPRRSSASSTSARPTMNVTVRNVITSMRLISWFDWAEFVESVSLVDEVLRAPAARSRTMDFATRDRYRHAVEELARGSGRTEVDVARRAVGDGGRRVAPRRGHADRRRRAEPAIPATT